MPNALQRDDDRRLNLEQQKTRAKELRDEMCRGEPSAMARLQRHHPSAQSLSPDQLGKTEWRLSDAQLVVARELGLPSWAKLRSHIEKLERARGAIARNDPAPDSDRSTIHSRCGSDIRSRLTEAGFVGEFLEFSDPLWQGPLIGNGIDLPTRAKILAETYDLAQSDSESRLRGQYEALATLVEAAKGDTRLVLWCEHDTYDQLCLARVLAEIAASARHPKIELIVVDRFPAIERFIGLGQLSPAALRSLWETRKSVFSAQLQLGVAVWHALCDRSPVALGAIAASGTPELPIMSGALRRHLQELPWTSDGLSLTQRLALQSLHDGTKTASELFWITQGQTEPLPFMGDSFFWATLRDMGKVRQPPIAIDDGDGTLRWPQQKLTLTEFGAAILDGRHDWMAAGAPERWVGGVPVGKGAPPWRWNESQQRPVLFNANS